MPSSRIQLCSALVLLGMTFFGCHPAAKETQNPQPTALINACDLLSKEEVGSVQGAPMTSSSGSSGDAGELLMTQCYYASSTPNASVSISVLQKKPGADLDPRDFWNKTFAQRKTEADDEKTEGHGRNEEKDRQVPPVKVAGVGDDAYWAPAGVGGTLYVLKSDRNALLRISVGGSDTLDGKLEKSKQLATKALSHF